MKAIHIDHPMTAYGILFHIILVRSSKRDKKAAKKAARRKWPRSSCADRSHETTELPFPPALPEVEKDEGYLDGYASSPFHYSASPRACYLVGTSAVGDLTKPINVIA
jgi:hypothetical protein